MLKNSYTIIKQIRSSNSLITKKTNIHNLNLFNIRESASFRCKIRLNCARTIITFLKYTKKNQNIICIRTLKQRHQCQTVAVPFEAHRKERERQTLMHCTLR